MAGVKGMRWGVTRSGAQLSGASGDNRRAVFKVTSAGKAPLSKPRQISEDKATVLATRKKSVSEMSNADLKRVNERMQLEQTYAQLSQKTSKVAQGGKLVKTIIGVGKTAADVYNMANSPAGKAAQEMVFGKKQ